MHQRLLLVSLLLISAQCGALENDNTVTTLKADVDRHHHHRHHHKHLRPNDEYEDGRLSFRTGHHHRHRQDELCWQVALDSAYLTTDQACGTGADPVPLDVGTHVTQIDPSEQLLDSCTSTAGVCASTPCLTWIKVHVGDADVTDGQVGWVAESFLEDCDSSPAEGDAPNSVVGIASTGGVSLATDDNSQSGVTATNSEGGEEGPVDGSTAPALPAAAPAAPVGLALFPPAPSQPVVYPPLLPVSGDGMCYWTMKTNTIKNDPATLRSSPCGTVIQTIPVDTSLTPLYASQETPDCHERTYPYERAQQLASFQANEVRRRALNDKNNQALTAAGKPTQPFQPGSFEETLVRDVRWWISVQLGTQQGWVAAGKVIKRLCDQTVSVTCPMTAQTGERCYLTDHQVEVKSSPCVSNSPKRFAPKQTIFVGVVGDTTAMPAGCQDIAVTFNGEALFITNTNLVAFDCNGDGWLSKVGPYTVQRFDKSAIVPVGFSLLQTLPLSKFLLHTTDGSWPNWPRAGSFPSPTLDAQRSWPHFILGRNDSGFVSVGQYYSMYLGSRALEDRAGFANSPNLKKGVVQVEIDAHAELPFTEYDEELTLAVRELYHAISNYTGIPVCKDSRVDFYDWRGSGDKVTAPANAVQALQRLDIPTFTAVNGLVGHSLVYSNSHWDPGLVDPFKLTT